MKWQTQKQINVAARRSWDAALDSSIKHWQQIYDAGLKEFDKAVGREKVTHRDTFCALCQRKNFFDLGCCALRDKYSWCCCREWAKVNDAQLDDDATSFYIASGAMLNKLKRLKKSKKWRKWVEAQE